MICVLVVWQAHHGRVKQKTLQVTLKGFEVLYCIDGNVTAVMLLWNKRRNLACF